MLLIIVISALVIALFFFTRSMAARNRAMNVKIASTWYRMGQQQLEAGNTAEAIESFRNATTNDHDNAQYTLSLATALAAADHLEEARQSLLRLRAAAPENGEINLNLARLSAREGEMSEAVRYYHNALFGIWPPDQMASQRTKVRTELVGFLLAAGDTSQALSELLILSSDIPDTEQAHNQVGRLFLEANDSQHALEQFTSALQLNGKNADALAGAGEATFDLADYTKARRYLEAAVANGSDSPNVMDLLETTKLISSEDPLAARIGTQERIRRLQADLDFASQELQSCISTKQDDQNSLTMLEALWTEIDQDMQTQFQPRALRRDPEGFTTGVNLIQRILLATEQVCGESSSLHKALLRIARRHGVSEQ